MSLITTLLYSNWNFKSRMNTKELIIRIIQEDLKHSQLLEGLNNLGLEPDQFHSLRLMDIVSDLMKVPSGKVAFQWGLIYTEFLQKAGILKIETNSESLRDLAESCYNQLLKELPERKLSIVDERNG